MLGNTPKRINCIDRFKKASMLGHHDVFECLLKYGAAINSADKIGCACLHYAILRDDRVLVKLILEKGANLEIVDKVRTKFFKYKT